MSFIMRLCLLFLFIPFVVKAQNLDLTHVDTINPLLSGVSCTSATLQSAITSIGSQQKTLFLTATDRNKANCVWEITTNITIPANIKLMVPFGVKANIAVGNTLEVLGCVKADDPNWYTGTVTQDLTCTADAPLWLGAMSKSYVQYGCLHAKAGSSTAFIPNCLAWVNTGDESQPVLQRVNIPAPTNIPLTGGDGIFYIAVKGNSSVDSTGWTTVGTTLYAWKEATEEPIPPTGMLLLSRTVITSGVMTEVGDIRRDNPTSDIAQSSSPMYGIKGNCQGDQTAGLQKMINNMAWRQTNGVIDAGCYRITRLFLNYDAVNNPDYPKDDAMQGQYELRGAGPMQVFHADIPWNRIPGTRFVSSTTDAPAVNAFAATGVTEANALRALRLTNFSVDQTTSSAVVKIDGANSSSSLSDVFIIQRGTGDGLVWINTFLVHLENIFAYTGNVANTGTGIVVYNAMTTGGVINLDNVTGRGFGRSCTMLGTTATDGKRSSGLVARGLQGRTCPIGLEVGGAVTGGSCIGCYFEDTTNYSVDIKEDVLGFTLLGGWFDAYHHDQDTDAAIRIGGTGAGTFQERNRAIAIIGARIGNVNEGWGILRNYSVETKGTVIQAVNISADSARPLNGKGIGCGPAGTTGENGLIILATSFGDDMPIGIDDTCRQGDIIQSDLAIWMSRRVNTGQGLAIVSEDEVKIPSNGNIYHLTGEADITKITCIKGPVGTPSLDPCLPGAPLTFFITGGAGNEPSFKEVAGGNLLLNLPGGATEWKGLIGSVIHFLFDGTKWRRAADNYYTLPTP